MKVVPNLPGKATHFAEGKLSRASACGRVGVLLTPNADFVNCRRCQNILHGRKTAKRGSGATPVVDGEGAARSVSRVRRQAPVHEPQAGRGRRARHEGEASGHDGAPERLQVQGVSGVAHRAPVAGEAREAIKPKRRRVCSVRCRRSTAHRRLCRCVCGGKGHGRYVAGRQLDLYDGDDV